MKEFLIKLRERVNFKENKVKHIIGLVIILLQIAASVVTIQYTTKLNILPAKYYTVLIAAIVVCIFLTIVLNLTKKIHIIGKIFGVLMCIVLIIVCVYEHHAYNMLNKITEEHYDIDNYVLVTLKDSKISDVKEMAGKSVGVVNTMNNEDSVNSAIAQLKVNAESDDISAYAYRDMIQMVEAMYNEDVDAILYNEALDAIIGDYLEDYQDRIKVISKYEVKMIVGSERPTYEAPTEATSKQPETESSNQGETSTEPETEPETEPPTEADNIKVPSYYNPGRDPNAPAGGGYIGGDNTVDNASKGPITGRTFTIYISGIDRYGTVSGRSRSDVNILVTVNPMTKEVVITNTPRDYYVPIPGVTKGNWRDKLTHAGIYGVWSSVATLENVYEIDIDYYVRVNFTSLISMVDALGGVEVYSEREFTSHFDNSHYKVGMNKIKTGRQALAFVRERYAFSDGDFQRGRNQMALVEAMVKKTMSPAILTNFTQLVNTVSNSVQTNMTMDEITALVKMQLDDGASWTIVRQDVTGSGAYRKCYSAQSYNASVVLPNQSSINKCKEKIKNVLNSK